MKTNFLKSLNGQWRWAGVELAKYAGMTTSNFFSTMTRIRQNKPVEITTRKKLIDGYNKAFSESLSYEGVDFNYEK